MQTWQPITTQELDSLLAAQLDYCSPEQRRIFEHCRVAVHRVPIVRFGMSEAVFVVAKRGDLVMYYEDVEEGFNISTLTSDGSIAVPGYEQLELRHALVRLIQA